MIKKVTYQGEEYSVKELTEMAGISVAVFKNRRQLGWSTEEIMNGEPINATTVANAKRKPKGRKLKAFATCNYRCNAK